MKKLDLAYLAGVIDSDGTIGIKKSSYSMRIVGDSTQPIYSERIAVKQVEPQAVDLAFKLFGGYRSIQKPSAKNGKPLHSWQVTDVKAFIALEAIRPFLRIKCQQASACLELRRVKNESKKSRLAFGRGHVGASKRPKELGEQMQKLKDRINSLNHVGI